MDAPVLLKRIAAITLILGCTSVAWFFLANTIEFRTFGSNDKLKPNVAAIWGAPQEQRPPSANFDTASTPLPLGSSRINVALALNHRQKGLLWYSTYAVDFAGVYTFQNATSEPQWVTYRFQFPAEQAMYDNVVMEVNGNSEVLNSDKHGAYVHAQLNASQTATLRVAYHSQGLESWRYKLGDDGIQARDFQLTMRTNFKDVDFPLNTLSPVDKRETAQGWDLTWRYQNLISGFQIGMTMPEKLQPGPLAGEISLFAPVSLLLFFFLMFIITTLRNIDLHPMNYFFLATAFFAFHLLLAYLVDHVSIHAAFAICSAVSVFLMVSYLRLVVGLRFAAVEAGLAQFVYLVLFSYAFFLKGFTGLAITIGCIVTLFLVMQLTGRIRWADRFAAPPAPNQTTMA